MSLRTGLNLELQSMFIGVIRAIYAMSTAQIVFKKPAYTSAIGLNTNPPLLQMSSILLN
jgi:hypothetical protein